MTLEEIVARGLSEHWYVLFAGWWLYSKWKEHNKNAAEELVKRRAEERQERIDQGEATREVVRDELAAHTKEEMAEFARFREDLRAEVAGITALVRQHETRLADIERAQRDAR